MSNIFDNMRALIEGNELRRFQQMIDGLGLRPLSTGYYLRFRGKSKTFLKNKRKGL